MTLAVPPSTWRQRVRSPLVIALLTSVILHLGILLLAWVIPQIVDSIWFPPWLKPLVAAQPPPPSRSADTATEAVMQFVEVNPDLVSTEPPPDSNLMSSANTIAANPDPSRVDSPIPKIDGKRPDSQKAFDTVVPVPQSEPPPQVTPQVKVPVEAASPSPPAGGAAAGETALAKPVAVPKTTAPRQVEVTKPVDEAKTAPEKSAEPVAESKPRRYKKVSEAKAAKGIIVAEKKQQEGGVRRVSIEASENVKASPFGDYALRLTAAVQNRWFELLDERKFSFERTGQVRVTFRLHSDGRVTNIVESKPSTVGENLTLLCILAIDQAAPFGAWPAAMRGWIGKDSQEITFTFNYLLN